MLVQKDVGQKKCRSTENVGVKKNVDLQKMFVNNKLLNDKFR